MNDKIGLKKENFHGGDIVCPKCEGLGTEWTEGALKIPRLCSKCGGEGKLDWLERLFGKGIVYPQDPPISGQNGYLISNDKRRSK